MSLLEKVTIVLLRGVYAENLWVWLPTSSGGRPRFVAVNHGPNS